MSVRKATAFITYFNMKPKTEGTISKLHFDLIIPQKFIMKFILTLWGVGVGVIFKKHRLPKLCTVSSH